MLRSSLVVVADIAGGSRAWDRAVKTLFLDAHRGPAPRWSEPQARISKSGTDGEPTCLDSTRRTATGPKDT
jgi:hypothetical protein